MGRRYRLEALKSSLTRAHELDARAAAEIVRWLLQNDAKNVVAPRLESAQDVMNWLASIRK